MGTIIVNASLNSQVNFEITGTITNIDFGDGSPIIASSADTSIIYNITFSASSLIGLSVQNNYNITSIDLSSTPSLIELYVDDQPYLTSVDVSNSAILLLDISNCYSFNTLDISSSNNLQEIVISRTQLSSIDLTSKTQLGGLSVTSSKLTSINTTPCSLLEKLQLYNNELSGITFGTHSGVTGTNLSMNKLTSINLSGLPNLTNINLGLNQLTSLNISSNSLLENLNLGGNNINATNLTSILVSLDGFGLNDGFVYISNQNPLTTPTPVGLSAISNLEGKNWGINYQNQSTNLSIQIYAWECDSLVNTFVFNVDQVYENGTIYNFSGYSESFTCGQVVGSDKYEYVDEGNTPLVGPYETCNECNNYDIILLERCNSESEIYQFSLSAFTGTPLVGDTYYLNFATPTKDLTPPLNILGCFSVTGFEKRFEEAPLSVLISATSETSCATCLEGNSKTYLVYHCNNFELTHYISLPDDSLIGHLITFNDIATGLEQFCGIVDSEQIGSVDISLVNDLGLYTEELCTQCLSTVAEKRQIVDCLDSNNVQVVWNSIFFESGDVSNLSTNDGCFTVSGLTEDDVTIQTFLDFDPQPDCQDCIQCNGVTYTAVSLDEECLNGPKLLIFASYQYLEIGQVISLNGSCRRITSVSPGISDFDPYYSLKTFGTCEECQSTSMELWEAIDCATNQSFNVIMVSGSSVNDIVHIKWGETDFLCVTLSNLIDFGIVPFYSDGITHNDCPTCSSTIELGLTIRSCATGVESYVKVTSEVWQNIVGYSLPFTVGYPVISDANGNCYFVINSCPITVQEGAQSFTPQNYYFNCPQCAFDNQSDNQRMARSANTEYNACVICCDCGSTATTVNSVTTPHPVYTDGFGTPVTQLNMVVLGGINGLNS